MKSTSYLVSGFLVTFASAYANAESPAEGYSAPNGVASEADDSPENVISVAPFSLIGGTVSAEYERGFGERVSLFVAPSLQAFPGIQDVDSASGYGISAGARFFFTGDAPEGLWIGPQAGYAYAEVEKSGAAASGDGYAISGLLGYSGIIADVLYLSAGAGVGYMNVGAEATSGSVSLRAGFEGILPVLRVNAGIAF